jgi:hypothetical protein
MAKKVDLRGWTQIDVFIGDSKKVKKHLATQTKQGKGKMEYIGVEFEGSLKPAYIIYTRPAKPSYAKAI